MLATLLALAIPAASALAADTTAPTVAVTAPASGATVTGNVTLGATATDDVGATQAKWYVDGREVDWDGSAPFQDTWNSASLSDGLHTLFAKAGDAAGNWGSSPAILITIANGGAVRAASSAPPGWDLVLSDDFSGSSLDTSKWSVYGPNWPGNYGNGVRDGRAVSVSGGTLNITAQMLGGTLVSGAVASKLSQTYGRFEFSARTDPDPSHATSGVVLTWPTSGNFPIAGENDIYETLWTTTNRSPIHSFIHYGANNAQYSFDHYVDGTQWHYMAMEWEPNEIRIYVDGALSARLNDANAIPDVAHHLCVQLDAFAPSVSGPVRMQIDDVRIYKRP
jgi:hypothetical protein